MKRHRFAEIGCPAVAFALDGRAVIAPVGAEVTRAKAFTRIGMGRYQGRLCGPPVKLIPVLRPQAAR